MSNKILGWIARMRITPGEKCSRRVKRRLKRHGSEYDIILEHFIEDEPSPFGMLAKSDKTGRYVWFDVNTIICIEDMPRRYIPIPELMEGMKAYTPDKRLLYEYLDHLMSNVLIKRDQKRFGPIYERVKDDQVGLFDRLNA